jgi:hypothetical protein
MEIGKQYFKDSKFKRKARLHQSKFRANILKANCDDYGNILLKEDGLRGLNFYDDFNILDSVINRYGKGYKKQLYSNLLRSEHIPFNFFIPLSHDFEFAKKVFNELLSCKIWQILEIKVEFAPEPIQNYLNDRTSFDTYIKYINHDSEIGILGIELKYTEVGYPLKKGSNEEKNITDSNSNYWKTSEKSGIFIEGIEHKLIQNSFRQIWRNQLLGESIKQKDGIKHFTSITFYPSGNEHFGKALKEYKSFLKIQDGLKGITFENYLTALKKYSNSNRYDNWIKYLSERYLFSNESIN